MSASRVTTIAVEVSVEVRLDMTSMDIMIADTQDRIQRIAERRLFEMFSRAQAEPDLGRNWSQLVGRIGGRRAG